jgi:hypothetical protein
MRVLIDTNILLRSAQPNHPLCSQATPRCTETAAAKEFRLFLFQEHRRVLERRDTSRQPEWARILPGRGFARAALQVAEKVYSELT